MAGKKGLVVLICSMSAKKQTGTTWLKIMTLFLIALTQSLIAQTSELDSLHALIKTMPDDTVKVNTMQEIARKYLSVARDYNCLNEIAWKELALSQKLGYNKGIANAYSHIGVCYGFKGNADMGLYYLKKSLQIRKMLGDEKGVGNIYNNMANIMLARGNYVEAQKNYLRSLKIKEDLADQEGIAIAYLNIGNVFSHLDKTDEAMGYYMKAAQSSERFNSLTYGNACNNIGNMYSRKKRNKQALLYHQKSLKAREEANDKVGITMSYNNLGGVYLAEKKSEMALFYYEKSYAMSEQIGNKAGVAFACEGIGNVYEEKGNFKEALVYYDKGLVLAMELNNKDFIKGTYENIASVYKKMKKFEQALTYTTYYNNIKDSLQNMEIMNQVTELNTRYETEKKAKEILSLTKEQRLNTQIIKQQQYTRWFLVGGIILLSITIISIYRRYLFKKKVNLELTETQNELYKVIEQKEKLTSILAHDLRTPLRFMTTVASHLEKGINTLNEEKLRKLTRELSTASKNTFIFADELLTWLTIQKQNHTVLFSEINLNELLEEMHSFFQDIASGQQTEINVKAASDIFVETDTRLLKIILRNILDNAVKNTYKGKITMAADLTNNGTVEIRIQDTGRGMTKEQLELLDVENSFGFQFEIKNRLGFQIIKDLIFKIKSKIEVKSELGVGTTVTIELSGGKKKRDAVLESEYCEKW